MHYIGQLCEAPTPVSTGVIKYLKREKQSNYQFVMTNDIQYDIALLEDCVRKLPTPISNGETARVAKHKTFQVDLSGYANLF